MPEALSSIFAQPLLPGFARFIQVELPLNQLPHNECPVCSDWFQGALRTAGTWEAGCAPRLPSTAGKSESPGWGALGPRERAVGRACPGVPGTLATAIREGEGCSGGNRQIILRPEGEKYSVFEPLLLPAPALGQSPRGQSHSSEQR